MYMYKKKNFFHSKTFLVMMIAILISLVAVLGTYTWLTWRSTNNSTLTTTIGELYTVTFENGADINANLTPVFNYTDGYSTDFSIISTDSSSEGLVTVELEIGSIDSQLCDESIKYVLYDETNDRIVGIGNLSEVTPNSTITILSNALLQFGTTDYTFYIYMDGNIENNISMMNKEFDGQLTVSVVEGQLTAGEYITNLYVNSDRINVTNNTGANTITYSYAEDEFLMKDRFGGTSTQETGNVRYYGSDPNNYVYFNCNNYNNQNSSNCELWRIIGVFNGKLKIVRNDPFTKVSNDPLEDPIFEKIAWDYDYNDDDTSTTTDYQNTWSTASLQNLLNNEYLDYDNENDITYWSFTSGDTADTTVDIQDYKIKNETTLNMISTENWYLNPVSSNKNYANQVYTIERTGSTIWNGQVGLISASDYAYSMNFSYCNKQLNNYATNNSTAGASCLGNSWINDTSANFWTITSGSGAQLVYTIKSAGAISTAQARIGNSYAIRPVVYLNTNIKIINGDGSTSSPYKLK